ncbi:hypothetical protein Esti_005583 [Eimeria stiedai]
MEDSVATADILFVARVRRQLQSMCSELQHLKAADLERKKEELRLVAEVNALRWKVGELEVEKQVHSTQANEQYEAKKGKWRLTQEQQQREITELKVLCAALKESMQVAQGKLRESELSLCRLKQQNHELIAKSKIFTAEQELLEGVAGRQTSVLRECAAVQKTLAELKNQRHSAQLQQRELHLQLTQLQENAEDLSLLRRRLGADLKRKDEEICELEAQLQAVRQERETAKQKQQTLRRALDAEKEKNQQVEEENAKLLHQHASLLALGIAQATSCTCTPAFSELEQKHQTSTIEEEAIKMPQMILISVRDDRREEELPSKDPCSSSVSRSNSSSSTSSSTSSRPGGSASSSPIRSNRHRSSNYNSNSNSSSSSSNGAEAEDSTTSSNGSKRGDSSSSSKGTEIGKSNSRGSSSIITGTEDDVSRGSAEVTASKQLHFRHATSHQEPKPRGVVSSAETSAVEDATEEKTAAAAAAAATRAATAAAAAGVPAALQMPFVSPTASYSIKVNRSEDTGKVLSCVDTPSMGEDQTTGLIGTEQQQQQQRQQQRQQQLQQQAEGRNRSTEEKGGRGQAENLTTTSADTGSNDDCLPRETAERGESRKITEDVMVKKMRRMTEEREEREESAGGEKRRRLGWDEERKPFVEKGGGEIGDESSEERHGNNEEMEGRNRNGSTEKENNEENADEKRKTESQASLLRCIDSFAAECRRWEEEARKRSPLELVCLSSSSQTETGGPREGGPLPGAPRSPGAVVIPPSLDVSGDFLLNLIDI